MPQNFLECDREQVFLMPPDVREWLPEGHLAWFVIDAVAEMDLSAFYAAYRQDGHGRAAYEPAMMVALLLYAYARGLRSSRAIERACEEDVAYRVLAANQKPDHATLATVCRAARARARRSVQRGVGVVCRGGAGEGWRGRDRWHEGGGERES
jgi:transposase